MPSTPSPSDPVPARAAPVRWAVAFLVSLLPGRLQAGRLSPLVSPAAVAVSGAVEAVGAALLHINGFLASVERFVSGEGLTYFQHAPVKLDVQALQGVGLLGMASYLVSPLGLFLVYLALEGTVRFAGALVEGRLRGVAVLAVPDALARALVRAFRAVSLELALGPPAPDAVTGLERPVPGLRVESREEKPWPVHQTLRQGEDFYVVTRTGLVHAASGVRRYRFDLRRLGPDEVIRGEVLPLVPGEGRPATWYGRLLWGLHPRGSSAGRGEVTGG